MRFVVILMATVMILISMNSLSYGKDKKEARKVLGRGLLLTAPIIESTKTESFIRKGGEPEKYRIVVGRGKKYGFRKGDFFIIHNTDPEYLRATSDPDSYRSHSSGTIISVKDDKAVGIVKYYPGPLPDEQTPIEKRDAKPIVGNIICTFRELSSDVRIEEKVILKVDVLSTDDFTGVMKTDKVASYILIDDKMIYERYMEADEYPDTSEQFFRPQLIEEHRKIKILLPFSHELIERVVKMGSKKMRSLNIHMKIVEDNR